MAEEKKLVDRSWVDPWGPHMGPDLCWRPLRGFGWNACCSQKGVVNIWAVWCLSSVINKSKIPPVPFPRMAQGFLKSRSCKRTKRTAKKILYFPWFQLDFLFFHLNLQTSPLMYHMLYRRSCSVSDDLFWTRSLSFLWGFCLLHNSSFFLQTNYFFYFFSGLSISSLEMVSGWNEIHKKWLWLKNTFLIGHSEASVFIDVGVRTSFNTLQELLISIYTVISSLKKKTN